ncbi:putative sulfate exporter family transporter [Bacillus pacificus]
MVWRAAIGVPHDAIAGTNFASKKLLRFGIILLGMRLNLVDIAKAGPKVLVIAAVVITFTIFVVYGLTKVFKGRKETWDFNSMRDSNLRCGSGRGNCAASESKR